MGLGQGVDAAGGGGTTTTKTRQARAGAGGRASPEAFPLPLTPLGRKLRTPDAGEKVFTLVVVLRVEFEVRRRRRIDEILRLSVTSFILLVVPRYPHSDPFRLEDELAHLVFLRLLAGLDVLPPQHTAAHGAANVADDVLASH